MSRGPKKSGFNPAKEYYRCPVKNCNSEFRGDEISRHFTKNANLDLLPEALENQSNLRKNLPSGEVVASSDVFLKNLLAQDNFFPLRLSFATFMTAPAQF